MILGAVSKGIKNKVYFIACILVLVVIISGCKATPEVAQDTTTTTVEEPATQPDVENEEPAIEPSEVEVEIKPVLRHDTAAGGTEIITPDGLTFSEIVPEVVGDFGVSLVSLPGVEYRKTYSISVKGASQQDGNVMLYLVDGSIFNKEQSLQEQEEWITSIVNGTVTDSFLATKTFKVSEFMNQSIQMTNSVKTVSEGMLLMVLPKSNLEATQIETIEVKRQIGELIFSDEFETDGYLSDDVWSYEVGGNGWGNGELQYYTDRDLDNARVEDGQLIITAQDEIRGNNDYTSARVRTKEGFLYGRYEIRAILPYGRGTWPAVWMMPQSSAYGNWPQSGEIDIMEHVGFDMDIIHANLHTGALNFRKQNNPTGKQTVPRVDTEPHTFIVEWSKYQIDLYIDDALSLSYKNEGKGPSYWPYDQPFYLIMNIAVGGAWGAQQGVDPIFPQSLYVDYVRFYNLNDEVVDTLPPNAVESVDSTIQGNMVKLEWLGATDDYLVDTYVVRIKKSGSSKWSEKEFSDTHGVMTNLEPETEYIGEIVAVDDSGNTSSPFEFSFTTQAMTLNPVDTWITIENRLYNTGGKIVNDTYIGEFEAGNQVGYMFDLSSKGTYQLEIETSGRLFNGLVRIISGDEVQLSEVVMEKTGADETFVTLKSEPFALESGTQAIIIDVVKNGFNIKNVRLVKVK